MSVGVSICVTGLSTTAFTVQCNQVSKPNSVSTNHIVLHKKQKKKQISIVNISMIYSNYSILLSVCLLCLVISNNHKSQVCKVRYNANEANYDIIQVTEAIFLIIDSWLSRQLK